MLGNFSFGGYGKEQAISLAWKYLIDTLELPPERLRVTVHRDDNETALLWQKRIPSEHISLENNEENFWQMGDTGPCGPCTEIFWFEEGKPPLEVWNIVFMQKERISNGELRDLPLTMVDTGMGLERMASVLQNVHSNFDIDNIKPLVQHVEELGASSLSARVIADHARAITFLGMDGVLPLSTGRGYVLRKILRRAALHGWQSGLREPFLHSMIPLVASIHHCNTPDTVVTAIEREEMHFGRILERGMKWLEEAPLNAALAFDLHDTHGFPIDLTMEIAKQRGIALDKMEFDGLMQEQQERARAHRQQVLPFAIQEWEACTYDGSKEPVYARHASSTSKVIAQGSVGNASWVVVEPCPLYARGGGQEPDHGWVEAQGTRLRVEDVQPLANGSSVMLVQDPHYVIETGDTVEVTVDMDRRMGLEAHHTATHMLHAGLIHVLGQPVEQAGSLVEPHRLRFDVAWHERIPRSILYEVENWVNQAVHVPVTVKEENVPTALENGVLGVFADRLEERGRVVRVGDLSQEFCGGTHVSNTLYSTPFVIVSESSVAAGIRRIEAMAGFAATNYMLRRGRMLDQLTTKLGGRHWEESRDRLHRIMQQTASPVSVKGKMQATWKGIPVIVYDMEDANSKQIGKWVASLRKKEPNVVHLAWNHQGVGCGVQHDQVQAVDIVQHLLNAVGGKGGGHATHAQGRFASDKDIDQRKQQWLEDVQ